MEIIEKIRKYIENLYDGEAPKHDQQCDFGNGYFTGLSVISNFLDTLSEEPDKSLEEAAEEFTEQEWDGLHDAGGNALFSEDYIQYAFKAGAEWQKEQDMDEWIKDRDGCFWDGVNEGKQAMKEQMLQDAIYYVVQDDLDSHGASYNIPFIRIGTTALKPKGIGVGDKVKVIVLKEEK